VEGETNALGMARHRSLGSALSLLRRSLGPVTVRGRPLELLGCAQMPPLAEALREHSPCEGPSETLPSPGFCTRSISQLGSGENSAVEWGSTVLGRERVLGTAHRQSGPRMISSSGGMPWHLAQSDCATPHNSSNTCTSTGRATNTTTCAGTGTRRHMSSAASVASLEEMRNQIKGTRENPPSGHFL